MCSLQRNQFNRTIDLCVMKFVLTVQKFRQQTQQNQQHNHVKTQPNETRFQTFAASLPAADAPCNRGIDNGRETDAPDRSAFTNSSTSAGGNGGSSQFASKINKQRQTTEPFDVAGKVHFYFLYLLFRLRHFSFYLSLSRQILRSAIAQNNGKTEQTT